MNEHDENKRCSKCLLPESLPGSNFNEKDECSWCQSNFPNYAPLGEEKLVELLKTNKKDPDAADCLVGLSGGKDSSYALMQLKNKYKLKVEAFTYVHDGFVGFALDNAKNLCKTLGIKHHIVSLPGTRHLDIFKNFFAAWMKTKTPLAAAMTCVPCKHLHVMGTRLAKKRKIPFVVWATCPLETPPFIPTQPGNTNNAKSRSNIDLALVLSKSLIKEGKFRNAFFKNIKTNAEGCLAFNPGTGYLSLKYPSVKHLRYFEYEPWNGPAIRKALEEQTSWKVPQSLASDWHSDCLFDTCKEYMYQTMFGVGYSDAFLSNQIRYGIITREEGYEKLMTGKAACKEEFPKVLALLGLEQYLKECDLSCFDH